ncbi:MAG: glycoside hydrolase family 57 protein, partial [Thermodesulfobacteriota bacterium]
MRGFSSSIRKINSMSYKLHIAVIWHMHQPYYKDLASGEYLLPWVRLHAIKDYYDMPLLLDEFPGIRQTFNLVPSLLAQIEDYGKGEGRDVFMGVSQKPASDLTETDKEFILSNFFLAHWENMVKPLPRYWELLHKRGLAFNRDEMREMIRFFSESDFRDLQVLFNLSWFDPSILKTHPFLASMVEKGSMFEEGDKEMLFKTEREIIAQVIPNYRRLMEEGKAELTTTPFYHPILPLLCNTNIASQALPHATLPAPPFIHPEDARLQVERAVNYHHNLFGCAPRGMWPSEGSVSEEALGIIASQGIEWVATDEEILEASTGVRVKRGHSGRLMNPEFLYKPYVFEADENDIAVIFRDHNLSDRIGFVYQSWQAVTAAKDFIERLHHIRTALGEKNRGGEYLVPVILDGENCWEHYKNDGRDFLTALYEMIEGDPLLEMVTVSEHLKEHPPSTRLDTVFPGSWINHNFKIWIGHEEDNRAWEYLRTARDTLIAAEKDGRVEKETLERAWENIYIAEGSDWCWWYGDENSTENDTEFDILFRKNLINVYTL